VDEVAKYDCVLIVTDHSDYDYARIAQQAALVVDTRNAMKGIQGDNIVRC
jgi:UDP-N-acetyl-D-glucosamine dehydrogenase